MYLAHHRIKGKHRYFIRESCREGEYFRSRELFDLGSNPSEYIIYPGGNAFYIDEVVEERLSDLGVTADMNEIEDVFWPFVKPRIRHALESFRDRGKAMRKKSDMTREQKASCERITSLFDKRRIHYLRSGRVDQSGVGRMPIVLYKWVFGKSRDEIEQRFIAMERRLNPEELKTYTFVIFDLQRFFSESYAKKIPQGLPQEKMDQCFIEEVCRLNEDQSFWAGEPRGDNLHEYLMRYVIMFFDNPFPQDTFLRDYVKEFMDSRRTWRFPEKKQHMGMEEASTIFGVDKKTLRSMSKGKLVRLFRCLAQKMHPDKGGTHEGFIKLTEAYRACLKGKPSE